MHSRLALVGSALVALVLGGCQSPAGEAERPDPWRSLTVNLTATEVRARLGEPEEIRPMKSTQGPAEIWVYRRRVPAGVRLVAARMENIPAYDPFSGQMHDVPTPVYTQESSMVDEELRLLMFEGVLINWKRGARTERSYVD